VLYYPAARGYGSVYNILFLATYARILREE